MWIQKIRLKNIKSYGEGDQGQGIFISLEPGVNQIAGKNGVGKSTIIEAVGYVLFDADPVMGNARMARNTYLLRNGSKSGEIDLWVWGQDCLYRVERDLGNGGRRWKVVREDDHFIEAEGDKEVREFLAKLAGVDRPERLPEVYYSLLGVKQGRFTLPFDLKPGEAKNHFDPLLDVDIFRQCFDQLKEPADQIRQDIHTLLTEISGLEGQMAQLQDAPLRLEEGIKEAAHWEEMVLQCQRSLHKTSVVVKQLDEQLNRLQKTRLEVTQIRGRMEGCQAEVEVARARVAEARQAQETLEQWQEHYRAFLEVEKQRTLLEEKRQSRDRLLKELAALEREETGLTREMEAAGSAAAKDRGQAEAKNKEYVSRWQTWTRERDRHRTGETEVKKLSQRAEEMKNALIQVVEWLKAMTTLNKQAIDQMAELETVYSSLDDQMDSRVTTAREALKRAEKAEEDCRSRLERICQDQIGLEKQLKELSSGMCPLLGTACNQFNPDKAKEDLAHLKDTVKQVTEEFDRHRLNSQGCKKELDLWLEAEKKQVAKLAQERQLASNIFGLARQMEDAPARAAAERLGLEIQGLPPEIPPIPGLEEIKVSTVESCRTLVESMKARQLKLYGYYQQWFPIVEDLIKGAQDAATLRVAQAKELAGEERALKSLTQDIQTLLQSAEGAEKRVMTLQQNLEELGQKIKERLKNLQEYEHLDAQGVENDRRKAEYQPGYTRYLQNLPAAERFNAYSQALQNNLKALEQVKLQRTEAEQRLQEEQDRYSEEEHLGAKEELARANLLLGEAKSKQKDAQRILQEQQNRVQILNKLNQLRAKQMGERARLQAQEKIIEKARQILKNSQELVARSLTSRVAARAQNIYNAMTRDASQFSWRSGDYSLSLTTVSGEKRFASLSGGQQMKAALAMQLALVKEFSSAGFCAFDEPTYGLDVEGRELLAEAIASSQEECRFEQLLLVSHDQAFDDKVEYAVKLDYSPLEGTRI
ncbi:SMC family ATPase [Desulforamulus ruminis]|uniref:Nuclease SbcCD subunit C n=1 Tax=Desulforamulus ruminis (strain ATCC 23193 / DSM 2154 / NCIMB 8452 / DL) TaxID=696281 RepID=F6DKJ9_DESRL|nr:SMC family ATPase [Desulforamulus ruminis]AEG59259.1 SMC domain protein [Desulforamulus ruminis DSM 2154]